MKTVRRLAVIILVAFAGQQARAADVWGYINVEFFTGDNLFQNNLLDTDTHLSSIFRYAPVPEGTTVSLWSAATNGYDRVSTYSTNAGVWSDDFELVPGTGARLHTVAPFTNMFAGMVVNRDGSFWDGTNYPPAPPFSGTNGSYLLGDKFAMPSSDTNVFLNVLGRLPNVGEQFTRLNATNQTYITSTYLGAGNWDIVPWITFGESGFFSLGTVFIPPASPFLSIALSGAAQVRVTWQTNASGYLLYYITNLTDSGWQQVTNLPTVVGDRFAVTMEQDGSQRFFRLQK